jgi:hypothetical protein
MYQNTLSQEKLSSKTSQFFHFVVDVTLFKKSDAPHPVVAHCVITVSGLKRAYFNSKGGLPTLYVFCVPSFHLVVAPIITRRL